MEAAHQGRNFKMAPLILLQKNRGVGDNGRAGGKEKNLAGEAGLAA